MNLYYDTYTAHKDKTESTGRALPNTGRGYFSGFSMPTNIMIGPWETSIDEMIADTKRGVYITRLHYVNPRRERQSSGSQDRPSSRAPIPFFPFKCQM